MRGGGPKGLSQPRRNLGSPTTMVEKPDDEHSYGMCRFEYTAGDQYSKNAGFDPFYEYVYQSAHNVGDAGWIIDLGTEEQLGWVSVASDPVGDNGVYEELFLWWSHDKVRWYKQPGNHNHHRHYSTAGGPHNNIYMYCHIQQPVQKARYWKITFPDFDSDYDDDYIHTTKLTVGLVRNDNVLVDVFREQAEQLYPSSFDYYHTPRQMHVGQCFNCGWPPEFIWNNMMADEGSHTSREGAKYWTALVDMKVQRASNDYWDKQEITQLLKNGFTIQEAFTGPDTGDTYTINGKYYGGGPTYLYDYRMWCWRTERSNNIHVGQQYLLESVKTWHSLGDVPDFAIVTSSGEQAGWQIVHKDLPAAILRMSYSANSEQSTLVAEDLGFDEEYVYHYPTLLNRHMLLARNSTGRQHFGSYTGNGSASGPSITAPGFQPDVIMIFKPEAANDNDMYMWDRDFEATTGACWKGANQYHVESPPSLAFAASGFTISDAGDEINESGIIFYYAVWKMD